MPVSISIAISVSFAAVAVTVGAAAVATSGGIAFVTAGTVVVVGVGGRQEGAQFRSPVLFFRYTVADTISGVVATATSIGIIHGGILLPLTTTAERERP